jgi:DNA-binding transcriptional ArsR family regulator
VTTHAVSVLEALGDRTRRAVFEVVATSPTSVTAIADQLPVSRPAVSQHLRVLRDAHLVTVTPQGTQRIYSIDLEGVRSVQAYFDQFWTDALDRFSRAADDAARAKATRPTPQAHQPPQELQ